MLNKIEECPLCQSTAIDVQYDNKGESITVDYYCTTCDSHLRTDNFIHEENNPSKKVSMAIKNWLEIQEDKTQIMMISRAGEYSAQDLILEIENQTKIGVEIEEKILQLTVHLLFRNKENI